MKNTTAIGNLGEESACEYLQKFGYEIVERNYRSRYGEIDIIAKKNKFLVVIEVKKRKNTSYGRACEFVTPIKQEKIKNTFLMYLTENKIDLQPRFDVIEINNNILNHIENAF